MAARSFKTRKIAPAAQIMRSTLLVVLGILGVEGMLVAMPSLVMGALGEG